MEYKDMTERQKEKARARRMERYYATRTPENRAKESAATQAWQKANPRRAKQNARLYRLRHSEDIAAKIRQLTPEQKAMRNRRVYDFYRTYPWIKHWQSADQRCNNTKCASYKDYGGRGIKLLASKADFQFLWFRDNAASMERPSVDRRDNEGPYSLDNCRFVEAAFNSRKALFDRRQRHAQQDAHAREADGQKMAESHLTSNDVK